MNATHKSIMADSIGWGLLPSEEFNNMQQSNLRFGVVGVGRIGKIHIENLVNRIPGAEVVAVCDLAAVALAAVAVRFGMGRTLPGAALAAPRQWQAKAYPTSEIYQGVTTVCRA